MLYFVCLSVIVLLNILLALFVIIKNFRNHVNITFFLFVLSMVLWMLSNYYSNNLTVYNLAFFVNKLIFIFSTFVAISLFYFSNVFPHDVFKLSLKNIVLSLIPIFIVNFLILDDKVISGITYLEGGGTGVTFDFGIYIYAITFLIYFTISIAFLVYKYFKFHKYERSQLQYLLFGISLSAIGALITNLLFPLVFNIYSLSDYGPFLTLFTFGFTAYAIVRHRLMDIRLVVARSVAYTLLIGILSTIYTAGVFIVSNFFFRGNFNSSQVIVYAILALFTSFTFQPLKNYIEKNTDKIFFRNRYSSNELLSKLTKIMASTLLLNDMTQKTLKTLLDTVHITRGVFIIFRDHTMYPPVAIGFDQIPDFNLEKLKNLTMDKRLVVFEEEENEEIKQQMRELNSSIILSLYVGSNFHGVLLLGEKQSGDIYSNQDIQVLEIFGPEVSVAIQNAKAYEEIRRFNITLKEEVEEATKDLIDANAKLRELDRLKDDFVSIASHELRTPMTAIRSYAWMALHKADIPLSEKMKKYLERTLTSTERLINLVNDMLNISRIESGRVEITPKVFELKELVQEVFLEVDPKVKEKELRLEIVDTASTKVFADPDKVHQVLLNLVGNAMKFTPQGGLITVSFFSDGQIIETSVKDTGVGIAPEEFSSLFKKFGRLDSSYTLAAISGGTGLGLYICKNLITMMGGKMGVKSPGLGKGTTFTFSLPVPTKQVLEHPEKYQVRALGETKGLEPVTI